jgi:long-chain acyl-CoA synthetase
MHELTLPDKLRRLAETCPDETAMVYLEDERVHTYTYGRLYQESLALGQWLLRQGLRKGERVALVLENRPEWACSYFGILLAGGAAVPVDVQVRADLLDYILAQTEARALITGDAARLAEVGGLHSLEKVVLVGQAAASGKRLHHWPDIMAATAKPRRLPKIAPGDVASIIYTSGTTGRPKGVMLTHSNFLANYASVEHLRAITQTDNFLALLPLHHAFPFMGTLLTPLFSRAKVTFLNNLKADVILRTLKEQGITLLVVTPQVVQHFYQGIQKRLAALPLGLGAALPGFLGLSRRLKAGYGLDLARPLLARIKAQALGPSFRFFISGGAKLPDELALGLVNLGLQVREGYGLTETSPVVSLNPMEAPRLGSVGQPLNGVKVRLHEPDAQGLGEILIQGDNVMAGYYKHPEATTQVIRDGWFHSGDLGYVDEDGYIFVKGRLKDVIVLASGKNVDAEEVAAHYLKSPKIKEICVLPDACDEKLVAVVTPNFDYFRASGESDLLGEIKWQLDYYSQQLEPYKRLKDFVLLNQELPKTRLGKVKRYEAQAIYLAQAGRSRQDKVSALEAGLSPAGEEIVSLLQDKTGLGVIALDDHLELDLGLDSLALVELLAALEERFGVRIGEGEAAEVFTVAELINFVEAKGPQDELARVEARNWGEILSAPPSPALLARIDLAPGFGARLFTAACSVGFGLLFRLMFRLQVSGRENLVAGGYMVCPNHASYLDGFALVCAMPWRLRLQLFFMGYSTYFDAPVVRQLVRLLRVIPVNSARHLVEAMQASAWVLRHGGIMAIFPEGARSLSGELRQFKKGVAILAEEMGGQIVPAAITGSYEAWSANTALPRPHPIHISFGQALSAAALKDIGLALKPQASDHEAIILGLRQEVLRLMAASRL